MHPSSTVRSVSSARVTNREAAVADLRAYRRERQHLYPLPEYQRALASGGTVTSFCGLDATPLLGDTSDVEEATEPSIEDCVTCVDVWRQHQWVRL